VHFSVKETGHAREALRPLVDAIVLTPNASGDVLPIEVQGNLGGHSSSVIEEFFR
jgi:hypothetical protein